MKCAGERTERVCRTSNSFPKRLQGVASSCRTAVPRCGGGSISLTAPGLPSRRYPLGSGQLVCKDYEEDTIGAWEEGRAPVQTGRAARGVPSSEARPAAVLRAGHEVAKHRGPSMSITRIVLSPFTLPLADGLKPLKQAPAEIGSSKSK